MVFKMKDPCSCKFHKGSKVYGILDSVVAEEDFKQPQKDLMHKCPLQVEIYPSHVYRDGDTIFDIRHRVSALRAQVYYQDMALNVDAHFGDDSKLKMASHDAVFITEFIWNPLEHSLLAFFDAVFAQQNNLCAPPGHPDRPTFERAGHTSMSIGDFILLRRCVPHVEGIAEYIDQMRLWQQVWICSADGWVLWG